MRRKKGGVKRGAGRRKGGRGRTPSGGVEERK